jgi:8-oxo-dGTP diphosphatase
MNGHDNRPKTPLLTVDAVVFDPAERLLLIRRKYPPFQGQYALPGGFVDCGETVERAVLRELQQETGLQGRIEGLVGVYSAPGRDPRRHTVSVAFLVTAEDQQPRASDDAQAADYVADWRSLELAFDHAQIAIDAAHLASRKADAQ